MRKSILLIFDKSVKINNNNNNNKNHEYKTQLNWKCEHL